MELGPIPNQHQPGMSFGANRVGMVSKVYPKEVQYIKIILYVYAPVCGILNRLITEAVK
jgi:hypothetical protein